jgi:hypothetical protein
MLTLDATLPGGDRTEVVLPVGANRVSVAAGKLNVLASAAGRTVYATASPAITVRIRQDDA